MAGQIGEVEAFNDFNGEVRQMVIGRPIIYRRRQQVLGFAVSEDEVGYGQNRLSDQARF